MAPDFAAPSVSVRTVGVYGAVTGNRLPGGRSM
jgi:hypothetical protein